MISGTRRSSRRSIALTCPSEKPTEHFFDVTDNQADTMDGMRGRRDTRTQDSFDPIPGKGNAVKTLLYSRGHRYFETNS